MKIDIFVIAGSLCCLLCQCARNDQKEVERYIVESERQWAESVATGDPTTVERILADDFLGVDPKGTLTTKRKSSPTHEMRHDISLPIALIRSKSDFTATPRLHKVTSLGNDTAGRGRFVWTDTWIRRNGRWQIVAAEDLIASESPR